MIVRTSYVFPYPSRDRPAAAVPGKEVRGERVGSCAGLCEDTNGDAFTPGGGRDQWLPAREARPPGQPRRCPKTGEGELRPLWFLNEL
jgi:hypothetical protein